MYLYLKFEALLLHATTEMAKVLYMSWSSFYKTAGKICRKDFKRMWHKEIVLGYIGIIRNQVNDFHYLSWIETVEKLDGKNESSILTAVHFRYLLSQIYVLCSQHSGLRLYQAHLIFSINCILFWPPCRYEEN